MRNRKFFNIKLAVTALSFLVTGVVIAAGGGGAIQTNPGALSGKHFDPKGKLPSKYTIAAQKQQRRLLPFSDKRDFAEQKKGFIAAPDYKQIKAEAGNVAWDMGSYEWLLQGKDFDSNTFYNYCASSISMGRWRRRIINKHRLENSFKI